jgi:hypothetical protein
MATSPPGQRCLGQLRPGGRALLAARLGAALRRARGPRPAYWKRPATQGLTAAEALRLLEGLCASRPDGLTNWTGRQEAQNGCAGHVTKDDRQDGPVDGGAAVCGQATAPPPWLSWPLFVLHDRGG